jgi:homoserine dehydrogenase
MSEAVWLMDVIEGYKPQPPREMDDLDRFRSEVETFLSRSGLTPTGFGKRAVADPSFVFSLRAGREPRRDTIARVRAFMRQPVQAASEVAA